MSISIEFQSRFKEIAGDLEGRSCAQKAELIGISNTTYCNAINYGIVPKVPSLLKIADFFAISLDYLVGISDRESFVKSDYSATFVDRLSDLKADKTITVYELSQRTHIHRNNIAQWMKKGYLPLLDDLIVLAEFFNVSLDFLLGRTDYKK